jgi:hypothetical protein
MKKKAAMELSVNTIIILIVAVLVLGLLIAFILSKLRHPPFPDINLPAPENPSTASPITYTLEKNSVDLGKELKFNIKILNTDPAASWDNAYPDLDCGTSLTIPATNKKYIAKTIEGRQVAEYTYLVTIPKTAAIDTYVCSLTVASSVAIANAPKVDVTFIVE